MKNFEEFDKNLKKLDGFYHPDDLERAMLTINPNLVSKLTDEDRSMCRVDLSLKCTKLAMEAAKKEVNEKLGSCDILVNGAGGNHPLGTTSNPFLLEEDLLNTTEGFKTFFLLRNTFSGIASRYV